MAALERPAWLSALVTEEPPPGVEYPEVLTTEERKWPKAIGAILLGILAFATITPTVVQLVVWLGWLSSGQVGDLSTYGRSAIAFHLPVGMLAVHLGIGMLLPVSLAVVLFVYRRDPRWLASVRPWFRWRYLFVSMGVAFVVLNVVLALSNLNDAAPQFKPQDNFLAFFVVILLTSPIQAAAEEFFFRGFLLQVLHPLVRSPWFGVVASAAVFALFHGTQNLALYLDRFGFGLLAAVLVVRTGGLEASIGAHVVNNILAFTYAGLFSTIAEVKAVTQVGWIEMAWDLVGFGIYTAAALWLGRRMQLATTTPGERQVVRDRWAEPV